MVQSDNATEPYLGRRQPLRGRRQLGLQLGHFPLLVAEELLRALRAPRRERAHGLRE